VRKTRAELEELAHENVKCGQNSQKAYRRGHKGGWTETDQNDLKRGDWRKEKPPWENGKGAGQRDMIAHTDFRTEKPPKVRHATARHVIMGVWVDGV